MPYLWAWGFKSPLRHQMTRANALVIAVSRAQASLDAFCVRVGDARRRVIDGQRDTVAGHAAGERLLLPPAPFPATLTVERRVTAQALVAFRGNRYSTPPELAQRPRTSCGCWAHRSSTSPPVRDRDRPPPTLAVDGAGITVRDHGHVLALDHAALAAATSAAPHRRKQRIPPGAAALAAATALARHPTATPPRDRHRPGRLREAAQGRNTLHMTSTTTPTSARPNTVDGSAGIALPAAPRPPCGPEARRRRRSTPTRSSTKPPPRTGRSPRPWNGCSRSRSTPPRPAAWPAGSGSPAYPPQPPSTSSTTTPHPESTAS